MTDAERDFERAWQAKLARAVEAEAGGPARAEVMAGSEGLSSNSPAAEVIRFSRKAVERLTVRIGPERTADVLSCCACRYPKAALEDIRRTYERTAEVGDAQRMLQERFETFLRDGLKLDEGIIQEVVRRGWGPAGVREGGRILATKIPKSGNLAAYLAEGDAAKRREMYCHCPRVRKAVNSGEEFPGAYCACGAGYYRGIWETILRQPVRVELLESVLAGGEVCRVAIHLPADFSGDHGAEKR
jgi:hypothetical protein